MTQVFVVEEAERKTTSTGKNYVRARVAGIGWVSIWGQEDANMVLAGRRPQTYKGEVVEKDGFKNLSGLSLAEGEAPTTDRMSKDEWRQKDAEDWLRRLYISHLSNLVALSAPEIGTLTYDKYRQDARMWATQDLLWIQGGGTEVPFS